MTSIGMIILIAVAIIAFLASLIIRILEFDSKEGEKYAWALFVLGIISAVLALVSYLLPYIMRPPAPDIVPRHPGQLQGEEVEITCDLSPFCQIYYTMNGRDAKTDGELYTKDKPIILVETCTVSARSKLWIFWSEPADMTYTVYDPGGYIPVENIRLDCHSTELKVGNSLQLHATLLPDYATDPTPCWDSEDKNIAMVDDHGIVTAINPGSTTITVSDTTGNVAATCAVTVIANERTETDEEGQRGVSGVKIIHSLPYMDCGNSATFSASVTPADADNAEITWSSSNPAIATVAPASGYVTAIAPGTVEIKAEAGGCIASAYLTVKAPRESFRLSHEQVSLYEGEQFGLSLIQESGLTVPDVFWSSDLRSVAEVDQAGTIYACSPGVCVVTAYFNDTALSCQVLVLEEEVPFPEAVWLTDVPNSMYAGETYYAEAEVYPYGADQGIDWYSEDPDIVSVGRDGRLHANSGGVAQIIAYASADRTVFSQLCITVEEDTSAPNSVEFVNVPDTMFVGDSYEAEAKVWPYDADQNVEWYSDDPDIISVDQYGCLYAWSEGVAEITVYASADEEIYSHFYVTVEGHQSQLTSVVLLDFPDSMCVGDSYYAEAEVLPYEANQSIVWATSNPDIVSVNEDGLLYAYSSGTAEITAFAADDTEIWSCFTISVEEENCEPWISMDIAAYYSIGPWDTLEFPYQVDAVGCYRRLSLKYDFEPTYCYGWVEMDPDRYIDSSVLFSAQDYGLISGDVVTCTFYFYYDELLYNTYQCQILIY